MNIVSIYIFKKRLTPLVDVAATPCSVVGIRITSYEELLASGSAVVDEFYDFIWGRVVNTACEVSLGTNYLLLTPFCSVGTSTSTATRSLLVKSGIGRKLMRLSSRIAAPGFSYLSL